jgi:hypothetical protein
MHEDIKPRLMGALEKQVRENSQSVDTVAFALEELGARSGQQSGDLQGVSNIQGSDSESVDELLEQGNAFEAEVVKGVEDAGNPGQGEVHTHEVHRTMFSPSIRIRSGKEKASVADKKIICPECGSSVRVEWRAAKWSSVYAFNCPACAIKLHVRGVPPIRIHRMDAKGNWRFVQIIHGTRID